MDNDGIDFNNLYFGISQKNLEFHMQRYKDMDTKAISIITITGILTSFLVGSEGLNSKTVGFSGSFISHLLFLITTILFLLTVVLSIWVIKVRYVHMFDTSRLLNNLMIKDLDDSEIMTCIIGNYVELENDLFEKCDKKGEKLKLSIYFLGLSVCSLIFYSISI